LVGSRELQGLALDNERGFLFVACGDHVVSLDVGHEKRSPTQSKLELAWTTLIIRQT